MKNQLTTVLTIVLTVSTLALFGQSTSGKKNVIEEERKVSDFNKISVRDGIDVEITQGNSNKLVIVASEKMIKKIITEVEDNELQISIDGNYATAKELTAIVTVKKLDAIKASSGSDVESENILICDNLSILCKSGSDIELKLEANSLICELNSGSDAELEARIKESISIIAEHGSDVEAKVSAQNITCKAKHGSDLELRGNTIKLDIEASGGSDISAFDLIAEDCKLEVSGGSDAEVHATKSLDIQASSASDVYYSGNPSQKNLHASSGSDIHSK